MRKQLHTPAQFITAKPREADAMSNLGTDVAGVLPGLEICEATYRRWRSTAERKVTKPSG